MWFQIDGQRWDLELVTLAHERSPDGLFCTFSVRCYYLKILEIAYVSERANPVNRSDPSFDQCDEENQDFFLWIVRWSGDALWRTQMMDTWTKGAGFGE